MKRVLLLTVYNYKGGEQGHPSMFDSITDFIIETDLLEGLWGIPNYKDPIVLKKEIIKILDETFDGDLMRENGLRTLWIVDDNRIYSAHNEWDNVDWNRATETIINDISEHRKKQGR